VGNIVSFDEGFETREEIEEYANSDVIAADTATATLFFAAKDRNKKAASLLLVDKNLITGEEMQGKEYQRTAMRQIVIALANV
jgi:purine-nucleoside phosphorylase